MNKKVLILPIAVLSLGLVGILSMKSAQAQTAPNKDSLIQRIVSKFNLNQTEVDKVIADFHSEQEARRLAEIEARLTEAVNSKKITQEQKDKILAKIKEWQSKKDDWSKLSPEDRRAKMEAHRDEMKAFAKIIGVDFHKIIGFGEFGKGGMGGRRMMENK